MKKNNTPPITYTSSSDSITYANYYDSMVKAVKHYPAEPVYMVYVHNEQCYYELLVNDMASGQYFEEGTRMSPYYINSRILKSGKQRLTYRLYPETGRGMETLGEFTNLRVEIGVVDQKKGVSFSQMDTVIVHHVVKDDKGEFIGKGKDYYEFTIEFEANVPYEEVGWTKSKDLRKLDPDELLERTEEAYQYIIDIINKKDKDLFAKINYAGSLVQYKNNYDEPEIIHDSFKMLEYYMFDKTLKMNALKDYKLVFYGDGRLVSLQLTNPDKLYRNRSAVYGDYIDEEGYESVRFLRCLLHIPEGKETFELW